MELFGPSISVLRDPIALKPFSARDCGNPPFLSRDVVTPVGRPNDAAVTPLEESTPTYRCLKLAKPTRNELAQAALGSQVQVPANIEDQAPTRVRQSGFTALVAE